MKHWPTALAITTIITAAACKKDSKPEPNLAPVEPAMVAKPAEPAVVTKTPEPAPPPPAPDQAATWATHVSKAGKFSVDLPGPAKESGASGVAIVGTEFGATSSDPRGSMCGVAYMASASLDANPKVVLDGATAKLKANAKVIEEKDVKVGKYPGRSLIVENSSHRKWMRAYLVDKTIFILNCGGPFDRASTDGPIATRVLDSFKLAN